MNADRLFDLTHPIVPGMPVFPGTPAPDLRTIATIAADGFAEKMVTVTTHTGTHMDAPAHILADGPTLDRFSVDRFFGPAVVMDLTGRDRTAVSAEMIAEKLPANARPAFVLLRTGWDRYWGDPRYFADFPVLTPEAARLLTQRVTSGVGIDAISVDGIKDTELPVHRTILGAGRLIIENLTGLAQLPASGFHFACFPLSLADADGSPVRAVAWVGGEWGIDRTPRNEAE